MEDNDTKMSISNTNLSSTGQTEPISADVTLENGIHYNLKGFLQRINTSSSTNVNKSAASPDYLHPDITSKYSSYQNLEQNGLNNLVSLHNEQQKHLPESLSCKMMNNERMQTAPAQPQVRTQLIDMMQAEKNYIGLPAVTTGFPQVAYDECSKVPTAHPTCSKNTIPAQFVPFQSSCQNKATLQCYNSYNALPISSHLPFDGLYDPMEIHCISNKSLKEKTFLTQLDRVNNKCARGIGRLTHVPLPMLERMDCNTMPERRARSVPSAAKSHKKYKFFKDCDLIKDRNIKCFMPNIIGYIDNMRLALANYCDEVKGVICLKKTSIDHTYKKVKLTQDPVATERNCRYCGYGVNYCPECGYQNAERIIPRIYTDPAPIWNEEPNESFNWIEKPFEFCKNCRCTFFGKAGECLDKDILCNRVGEFCKEAGECVDEAIADCIKSCTIKCTSCLPRVPQMPRYRDEGYAMYEPDPYFNRIEKPTRATGNSCVDTVNAFLDHFYSVHDEAALNHTEPKIPDTIKTGNWVVDKLNEFLDDHDHDPPKPQSLPKQQKKCPMLNCQLNPLAYCTEQSLPPTLPAEEPTCTLLGKCQPKKSMCPACHQQLRKPIKEPKKTEKEPCCGKLSELYSNCTRTKFSKKQQKPVSLAYPLISEKDPQGQNYTYQSFQNKTIPSNNSCQPIAFVGVPAQFSRDDNTSKSSWEPENYPRPLTAAYPSACKNEQTAFLHFMANTEPTTTYYALTPTITDEGRFRETPRAYDSRMHALNFQQLPTVYMPPDVTLASKPSQRRNASSSLTQNYGTSFARAPLESCFMSNCCTSDIVTH